MNLTYATYGEKVFEGWGSGGAENGGQDQNTRSGDRMQAEVEVMNLEMQETPEHSRAAVDLSETSVNALAARIGDCTRDSSSGMDVLSIGVYLVALVGCVMAGIGLLDLPLAQSAPQQAAIAAMALANAVIPYVFARIVGEIARHAKGK